MKYLIIIVILVTAIFGGTYYFHSENLKNAKKEISEYTIERESTIELLKTKLYQELNEEDSEFGEEFINQYDILNAQINRDTTISLFVYEDGLEIIDYEEAYLECLASKSKNDVINARLISKVNYTLDSINAGHSNASDYWTSKMKSENERFLDKNYNVDCDVYFEKEYRYSLKERSFNEFDAFLQKVAEDEIRANKSSQENEIEFNSNLRKGKSQLNSEGKAIFNERFNAEPSVRSSEFSYSGSSIGTISYTHPVTVYPNNNLESNIEYAISEQYRNNSLRNGSMPYSYCYGSSNSGSSAVKVNAGNEDVLVMIKNIQGRVIRHSYVKAHRTYQLNVPNGSYRVFFYYGKGWNPTKFMKETTCGTLKGGFHSNEIVDKDPSVLSLNYQVMTYTLTSVLNGNFNTTGSSKNEAF